MFILLTIDESASFFRWSGASILPLSLPSGVASPAGHPAIAGAPHVPFAPVPNNTQSPVVNNSNKEDQSDPDQVRDGQCGSRE